MQKTSTGKNIKNGRNVVSIEKKSIDDLHKRFSNKKFSEKFSEAVELIYKSKGKVVVTGIGKSGIIAYKIAATFNSTGTYAFFLNSADSIHGDMGVIRKGDVALLISKSGDISEIRHLIPALKSLSVKIISIVGNLNSELAKVSDIVLDASVKKEACPHNLAPTSSTTVALVLGDAIAIALLEKNQFTSDNFALVHPGGNLGKRLLLKVDDIMSKDKDVPVVKVDSKLKDVIYMISSKRLGCTCVTDKSKIAGIITDGDIRRLLEKNLDGLNDITAAEIMNSNPKIISKDMMAISALEIMEKNKITQLVVGDKSKKPVGMIHMHRLIEEGL